jgi:hypothetical protein
VASREVPPNGCSRNSQRQCVMGVRHHPLVSKELQMRFRLTRSAYLLALLAAFVVASGAGHKLGAP